MINSVLLVRCFIIGQIWPKSNIDKITELLYDSVIMIQQLINDEKFTNIQKAQAGLTKLFAEANRTSSFYRVMKNDVPLGVMVPNDMWQSIMEDLEALSSPSYLKRIKQAREEKKRYSSDEVKKMIGLK